MTIEPAILIFRGEVVKSGRSLIEQYSLQEGVVKFHKLSLTTGSILFGTGIRTRLVLGLVLLVLLV